MLGHEHGVGVSSSLLLSLLVLLALAFELFAVGEEGLVHELGLVLEPDPVSDLMISYSMLQDHGFKHLLHLGMEGLTSGNEVTELGQQGIDTLIGKLADIGEKLIPEVPEMLLSFDSCADNIKGFLGHLLFLHGDGPIVNEGLQAKSVYLHPQTSSSTGISQYSNHEPHWY